MPFKLEKAYNILSMGARIFSPKIWVLKMKNTQVLERGLYLASNQLDLRVINQHESLISERYG